MRPGGLAAFLDCRKEWESSRWRTCFCSVFTYQTALRFFSIHLSLFPIFFSILNTLLQDLTRFDAQFFGVHAKQAHLMDPQLRMFLETTYEAIVDAGYDPQVLRGYLHLNFNSAAQFVPREITQFFFDFFKLMNSFLCNELSVVQAIRSSRCHPHGVGRI